MILFTSDYERYPSAIIDDSTSNRSFLELAAVYRSMGVRNYAFLLTLLNPSLRGVDPHSPNLTPEQMQAIGIECRYNPWYLLREVIRIPGSEPIPYIANRGNIALTWSFLNHIDFILIQPRQTGKSVSTDCIMVGLIQFWFPRKASIGMVTKDDSLRRSNVDRIKEIRDLLPGYLYRRNRTDADNQHEITNYDGDKKIVYRTAVAQGSESAAHNVGRGFTSEVWHFDEAPFIKHIETTMQSALAAGTAARTFAERNGTPYGNIFTTTAGKKDSKDGKFVYKILNQAAGWSEHLFDSKNNQELRNRVEKAGSGAKIIINGTFSHRQLGYSDEWLYRSMANASADGQAAERDFLNVWTSGTESSPLKPELNLKILESEIDPVEVEYSKEGFTVNWYVDPRTVKTYGRYVLGLDTSDAVGRDAMAGVMIDVTDLSVVGTFNCNDANITTFSTFIANLLDGYPTITMIHERKSSGQALLDSIVLQLLIKGINPFRRIFNLVVDQHNEHEDAYRVASDRDQRGSWSDCADRNRKFFGFNTTGTSRKLLYGSVLQNTARTASHLVRDTNLSKQIRELVTKDERIDHAASGHDDAVIAWLLASWFITTAKNHRFYGIDSTLVLSKAVATLDQRVDDTMALLQELDNEITVEQTALLEEYKKANDPVTQIRIEARLRQLESKRPPLPHRTVMSIDGLIQEANRQRGERIRKRFSNFNRSIA